MGLGCTIAVLVFLGYVIWTLFKMTFGDGDD